MTAKGMEAVKTTIQTQGDLHVLQDPLKLQHLKDEVGVILKISHGQQIQ